MGEQKLDLLTALVETGFLSKEKALDILAKKENNDIPVISAIVDSKYISADNVNNSQCPVPLVNANGGATFEGWACYFPTQDLVDQYLVTDDETGEALPWYETSQYKNNVEELDPSIVTTAGQIDTYNQLNGDPRRMPTSQDLIDTKDGYAHFSRYVRLKNGVTRSISSIMYDNRDKRFAASIIYDNCTWVGENVETNLGGNLGSAENQCG